MRKKTYLGLIKRAAALSVAAVLITGCGKETFVPMEEIPVQDTVEAAPVDESIIEDTTAEEITEAEETIETTDIADIAEDQAVEEETQTPTELTEVVMKEEFDTPAVYVSRYICVVRDHDSRHGKFLGSIQPGEIIMVNGITENDYYRTEDGTYISCEKALTREDYEAQVGKVYIFTDLDEEQTLFAQTSAESYSSAKENAEKVSSYKKGEEVKVTGLSDDGSFYRLSDGSIISAELLGETKPQTQTAQTGNGNTGNNGSTGNSGSSGSSYAYTEPLVAQGQSPAYTTTTVTTEVVVQQPQQTVPQFSNWLEALNAGYDVQLNDDGTWTAVSPDTRPQPPQTETVTTTVTTGPDTINGVYTYDCYAVYGILDEVNKRRRENGKEEVVWESSWEARALEDVKKLAPTNGMGVWDNFRHPGNPYGNEYIAGGYWGNDPIAIDAQYASSPLHNSGLHGGNYTKMCSVNCDVYIDGKYYASYNLSYNN